MTTRVGAEIDKVQQQLTRMEGCANALEFLLRTPAVRKKRPDLTLRLQEARLVISAIRADLATFEGVIMQQEV